MTGQHIPRRYLWCRLDEGRGTWKLKISKPIGRPKFGQKITPRSRHIPLSPQERVTPPSPRGSGGMFSSARRATYFRLNNRSFPSATTISRSRLFHSSKTMRTLTVDELNRAIRNVEYAVRGELAIKAEKYSLTSGWDSRSEARYVATWLPSSLPEEFFSEWDLLPVKLVLGLNELESSQNPIKIRCMNSCTYFLIIMTAPKRKVSTSSDKTASMTPIRLRYASSASASPGA